MSASIIALSATTRGGLPFGLSTQWLKGSPSWRPHLDLLLTVNPGCSQAQGFLLVAKITKLPEPRLICA